MPDINLVPKEYRKRKVDVFGFFSKTGGILLFLLILSLLIYGGLLLYQKKLNENLDTITAEIDKLDQKRDFEKESRIIELDKKITVLKTIFQEHVYWSEFFKELENLTVENVYFSDVKFDLGEENLSFSFTGNGLTYTDVARQMVSFQEMESVKSVNMTNFSLSEKGGIDFDLSVEILKEFLIKDENE